MSTHDEAIEQAEQIEAASGTSGRRELFTKAGAAAAVAAVAGLGVAKSAEAADGGNLLIGRANVGNNVSSTTLSGGSSFYVIDGVTGGGAGASIRGRATGDDGIGVRGEAAGSAGRGIYGENTGRDGSGVYGVTSANGTSGGGVYGRNNGDGHGVKGRATDANGAGVYGQHIEAGGRGVYGHHDSTTQTGTGVLGVAVSGIGVEGRGTPYDLAAGSSGRVGLHKAGNNGSPTDTGAVGTIARDSAGNLWYCYAADKWQRLGGPGGGGSFHPISPVRVFDSRNAGFPGNGTIVADSFRVLSVKDGRDMSTGAVTAANAVPAGATAVAFNVTATNTTAWGFLSVVPADARTTSVSTLNWVGAANTIANSAVSKLDGNRQLRIIAGPGSNLDAIIDISGYYL